MSFEILRGDLGSRVFGDTFATLTRPAKNVVRFWGRGIMDRGVRSYLHNSFIEFDVLDEHSPICQAYGNDINSRGLLHGRNLAEEEKVGEFRGENGRGGEEGA